MRIPEDIILDIKYKNPIEDVISPYVQLKRAGKNLQGLCPFHSEKTPSFTVYPDSNSYYCFGCGNGGDAVTFIKNIENLDYVEALKLLADKAGVVIPEGEVDDSVSKLKSKIYEINKEAAKFYYDTLKTPEGKWALDYLTGRALSTETITHFGLGCAPDSWDKLLNHLKGKGFYLPDIEQAGLIMKNSRGGYYDRFRNKVMFPIVDLQKRVIGFSGRMNPADTGKGGKYINTSDTLVYKKSYNLFGMNFAKNNCKDGLILVEGNMDVISLHQAGFNNAVAALGTAFTDDQARLIARYTDTVTVMMDSDGPGIKATNRAIGILENAGIYTKVVHIPEGKDPDEYVKNNGKEKMEAVINGAASSVDFKLNSAKSGLDLSKDADRVIYLNLAAEILAEENDDISVDIYSSKIAEQFGSNKSVLISEIKKIKEKNKRKKKNEEFKRFVNPKLEHNTVNREKIKMKRAVNAEEVILAVLIKNPDFYGTNGITEDLFLSNFSKRIFNTLVSIYENSKTFDISYFSDEFNDNEIGYITALSLNNDYNSGAEEILKNAVNVLKEEKLKAQSLNSDDLVDEDWKNIMQNIIEKKVQKDGRK